MITRYLVRIDHVAIFVLIAGSYTPICYFYLTGWMQIGIIAIQWRNSFGWIIFKNICN